MYTIRQDTANKLTLPFVSNYDYLLIVFTNRCFESVGIFENTAGLNCDYEVIINEVGQSGTSNPTNGDVKISPQSTWKASVYGQDNNTNLFPEYAVLLYDITVQVKGTNCKTYPNLSPSIECAPATAIIKDTNDTILYTLNIPSGQTVERVIQNAISLIRKSNGDLLRTVFIPAEGQANTLIGNSSINILRSDGTNIKTVEVLAQSGTSTNILDSIVTVLDQDGNVLATENVRAQQNRNININIPPSVEPLETFDYEGLITFQDTIYAVGDDKWVTDNVLIPEINLRPSGRSVVFPRINPTDFTKLAYGVGGNGLNNFGNLERFTDDLGGQTYANNLVIDHLTGIMITNIVNQGGDLSNWEQIIDFHYNLDFGGFQDWFTGNWNLYESIADKGTTSGLNYSPFNFDLQVISATDSNQIHTSTTSRNSSASSVVYANGYSNAAFSLPFRFIGNSKTNNKIKGYSFRKAFTYDQITDKMILT